VEGVGGRRGGGWWAAFRGAGRLGAGGGRRGAWVVGGGWLGGWGGGVGGCGGRFLVGWRVGGGGGGLARMLRYRRRAVARPVRHRDRGVVPARAPGGPPVPPGRGSPVAVRRRRWPGCQTGRGQPLRFHREPGSVPWSPPARLAAEAGPASPAPDLRIGISSYSSGRQGRVARTSRGAGTDRALPASR